MEGIRGPAAAREERKNRARCKNKKLSWRRFLASSLTSPRCCSSPVAPRVLLDGVACILPVVSRGGAAAGRAHRVLGKEKERERERALVLLPLPLPFLFSLFSLSLSELLLSLSLSLPPSPPLLIRSDVSLDITGTHWQRQRDREKKTRSLERAPPRESTKRESDDRSIGFSSFFYCCLSTFAPFSTTNPFNLPPPPCCRSASRTRRTPPRPPASSFPSIENRSRFPRGGGRGRRRLRQRRSRLWNTRPPLSSA